MTRSSKIEIKKISGKTFELWKIKMKYILVEKNQCITIDPGIAPMGMSTKYWAKLVQK